jgi:signal transduction histidine kinase
MKANDSSERITMELKKTKGIINSFINSCSHNLKSPLTSIEGLVLIAEYCTNPKEVDQCLGMIQHCALSMLDMIHKLEEYASMQNHELNRKAIQAHTLVEKIMNKYGKEINQQQITISITISQSTPWVSDEYCNYVILSNLVGNAIHFHDNGKGSKKINIEVAVAQDQVSLTVSDNGIGIIEEEKQKIFEPFRRGSGQSKGNGLGLFLVKSAIEKLQASISLESKENLGASFRISIPNNQAA